MAARKKSPTTKKSTARRPSGRTPLLLVVVLICAVLIVLFYVLTKNKTINLSGLEWFNKESLIRGDEINYDRSKKRLPAPTTGSRDLRAPNAEQKPAYEQRDREYLESLLK